MRAIEYLPLDPLQIIARSHDITLHSRVLEYMPGMWERVTYWQRKFFDYIWEVYKPENKDRFGYYTSPVLWGDRLVARFDSKLDRTRNTFVILGWWLEAPVRGRDEAFAEALACGFARFVSFLGTSKLDTKAIREPLLRRRVVASKPA